MRSATLVTGGGDKWPLHFYWTMLALRIGAKDAFDHIVARSRWVVNAIASGDTKRAGRVGGIRWVGP